MDIAIVGIGCRFPGGVEDPVSFWKFLMDKGDGVTEIPADRWRIDRFYDPDPEAPGRMYVRQAGFLTHSLWDFDAEFFGISQKEAAILDPQQRLLLETSWEALDDAGMAGRISGSSLGVFVGGFVLDNAMSRMAPSVRSSITPFTAMSASLTLLSNRISYVFDTHGPSITVDTACSSSLVATHLAVQALEREECEAALVGGANVMVNPDTFVSMCKSRFLAFDGRCKTFDADADGYGRAEGSGMVVLKPLAAAQRDGDRIYAVISATGSNQDGRTLALPVPNQVAQEDLARRVRDRSGFAAHEISYVESHGTGTAVGDPIEMRALGAVYGAVDGRTAPVPVGSLKNNWGHTEAAAGVAGLIKAALTLQHKTVAPQFRVNQLNPAIPFEELRIRVPMEQEPLVAGPSGRNAVAVNGFGYGGSNAHVVLAEAPAPLPTAEPARPVIRVLPLSGRSEAAAREMAGGLVELLDTVDPEVLTAATWTRRAHHAFRAGVPYTDADDLRDRLTTLAAGGGRALSRVVADGTAGPVFVYSGMGPQWWAMGRGLLESDKRFRAEAEKIDAEFTAIAGWSIIAEMLRDEADSHVMRTEIAQPANFLVQAALTAVLAERGVTPAVVVGHSVGEVTAAYVSGALSLTDAVLVSYHRSRLQASTAGSGGMLAVGLSADEAEALIAEIPQVSLAAVNGPTSVTLAGDTAALESLDETLSAAGAFVRMLRVEVPYHSHLMDPILGELTETLAELAPREGTLAAYSTVTAGLITGTEWTASYWCDNVREPVRFADTIAALLEDGHRVFLEVGPHPVLSGNIREQLVQRGIIGVAVPTLARGADDEQRVLEAVAELYAAGGISTAEIPGAPDVRAPHLDLPRYPWQKTYLRSEDPVTMLDRFGLSESFAMLRDPIGTGADTEWEVRLAAANLPWLPHHVVAEHVVVPGAAYLDAALSAAAVRTGRPSFGLESVQFTAPLLVDPHDVPILRVTVEESTRRFTIRSKPGDPGSTVGWTVNARGRLIEAEFDPVATDVSVADDAVEVGGDDIYRGMAQLGLDYGPSFRRIASARVTRDRVVATLSPLEGEQPQHLAHPAVVDSALQCVAALAVAAGPVVDEGAMVPYSITGVRRLGPIPEDARVVATLLSAVPFRADVTIADAEGHVALRMSGVEFRSVAQADVARRLDRVYYEPVWERLATSAAERAESGDEAVAVFCAGDDARARAERVFGDHPVSSRTVLMRAQAAGERIRAALLDEYGEPIAARIRVVFVAGDELDSADQLELLVELAKVVQELSELGTGPVGGEQAVGGAMPEVIPQGVPAESAAPRMRGVVVTEFGVAMPTDETIALTQAGLVGARRELFGEQPQVHWSLIDLDGTAGDIGAVPYEPPAADAGVQVAEQADAPVEFGTVAAPPSPSIRELILADGTLDEIVWRDGALWAPRISRGAGAHLAARTQASRLGDEVENFELEIPKSRLLIDLALRETVRVAPGPGEVELRIEAVGLNYKDTMKIVGMLTEKELAGTYYGTSIGMEAAAEVVRIGAGVTRVEVGDRVFVTARGLLRKYVTMPAENFGLIGLLAPASELADPAAATAYDPLYCGSGLPFLTAVYGLRTLARLRSGETVLIHGAAGGMGQAAIQVALHMGATVIGTASTPERQEFVRGAGAHHVLNSRSASFADEVFELTGGRGADVIYTSAPGELGAQNLRAAAEFGRIVDIGKADIYTDGVMDLRPFDRNLSFFAVDMDRALAVEPDILWNALQVAMKELAAGRYRWLPYRLFGLDQLPEAFEAVARAEGIGRVVLDFRTAPDQVRPPVDYVEIRSDGSYLITGGFGAFGLATARWLAREGARRLVLAGRSGASTEMARRQLAEFAKAGVEVVQERVDLADYAATAGLIARIQDSGHSLRGVFHAAGVVNNVPVSALTRAELDVVVMPKARGGANLYRAVSAAGVKPDVVVLYSSVSAWGIILPQLSYASANYSLDALAALWRREGVRALSVNWGYMGGGGMAEASEAVSAYISAQGYHSIDMDRATTLLHEVLSFDVAQAGIVDADWVRWAPGYENIAHSRRFARMFAEAGVGAEQESNAMLEAIMAVPPQERVDYVVQKLVSELAKVLGVGVSTVDVDAPITELGMDSLTAVEFGARAEKELSVKFSLLEFSRGMSVRGISAKMVSQLVQQAGVEGANA